MFKYFKNKDWHLFFHRADRLESTSRLKRRASPIHAYIGPNGSGKSLMMIHDTIPSLEQGRPVLSTVRILDYKNPRPCDDPTCTYPSHPNHQAAHPLWVPLKNLQQLIEFRDGDILLDEVQGVVSSREYSSLPAPVATMLLQLRRRNVALRWSAPTYARADKLLREVTQSVSLCNPYFAKRKKTLPGEPVSLWYERSAILILTFAAELVDEVEARALAASDTLVPRVRQFYFRKLGRSTALAQSAYDTYDRVLTVSATDILGTCLSCGGKRTQAKCLCGNHPQEKADLVTRSDAEQTAELIASIGDLNE